MDKVATGQVILPVLRIPPVIIIPTTLHIIYNIMCVCVYVCVCARVLTAEADDASNYHWVPSGSQMRPSEVIVVFI